MFYDLHQQPATSNQQPATSNQHYAWRVVELPAARKRRTPTREVERSLWEAGHEVVAGVDETGWGALAGTVSVGAAVVPKDLPIPDRLRDSKALK